MSAAAHVDGVDVVRRTARADDDPFTLADIFTAWRNETLMWRPGEKRVEWYEAGESEPYCVLNVATFVVRVPRRPVPEPVSDTGSDVPLDMD